MAGTTLSELESFTNPISPGSHLKSELHHVTVVV